MNIAYDNVVFSLQRVGGISNYWYQLSKRLQNSIDHSVSFYEFKDENLFRKELKLKPLTKSKLPLQLFRYLPLTTKLPSKAIFHSSYYRVCLQKDVINITTVYDFLYEYYSNILAPSKFVHSFQKRFSVTHSQGVICISESTKKDLLHFYPHIDPELVKVIYLGADERFTPLDNKQLCLSEINSNLKSFQYILYVGSRKPYKNFSKALEVISLNPDLLLVVIGGKEFSSQEKKLFSSFQNRVLHFTGVDSRDLNVLYNNAFCLLYPSIYEGFGIPPLEAMKAGCPVVSTNSSSIPEVVGDAGLLVSTVTTSALVDKLNILRNKSLRMSIINSGIRQAKKFSWDRCFEQTVEFYEETYRRSL